MTAVRMDGKELAAKVRENVAREVAELGHVGLATVLVGDDPASHVYIAAKHKAATEAGIDARDIRLSPDTTEADVLALVDELNNDPEVDGILVQLPLPAQMSETKVTYAVAPAKDVDGFHPVNAGNLYLGTPIHVPATPSGCMELLRAYDIDPVGQGGGRDRPQRDRRAADGDAAHARARDRHDLPLPYHRPRGARSPRRHRRRGGGPARHRDREHGEARCRLPRRRADANGRRDPR